MLTAVSLSALILAMFFLRYKLPVIAEKVEERKSARVPYRILGGRNISDFFKDNQLPYVLDIRNDAQIRLCGLKHSGSTVIMYIPFDPKDEAAFRKHVSADSRMLTVHKEKRAFLVMCGSGTRSARACAVLVEGGFRPVHLYDGLDRVPEKFIRYSRDVVSPPKE